MRARGRRRAVLTRAERVSATPAPANAQPKLAKYSTEEPRSELGTCREFCGLAGAA
jgi:hypothetical protein